MKVCLGFTKHALEVNSVLPDTNYSQPARLVHWQRKGKEWEIYNLNILGANPELFE